tara:strand:- start:5820 stop:6083 length:264 start_codon:yes stop_codon:yes gene_type:complete
MRIEEIETPCSVGTYEVEFTTTAVLDTFGRLPGLSDVPLTGPKPFSSSGVVTAIDKREGLVEVEVPVETGHKKLVIKFDDVEKVITV